MQNGIMKHMNSWKKVTIIAIALMAQSSVHAQCVEPLPTEAWEKSTWISVKDAPIVTERVNDHTRSADGANWFVSTFQNTKKIASARWMTTGLGVYDLYVNGTRIGREILKPGFTNCFKTKLSFTYDITAALRKKAGEENELTVQVTPGWWADNIITPGGSQGMYGTRCAFRGVLELVYMDGSRSYLGTNENDWQAGIGGPVRHASIYDGETYDARQVLGTEVKQAFKKADVNTEFHGDILPTSGAEVYLRHDLTLHPTRAYVWKEVEGKTRDEAGKVVILREYPKGRDMVIHKGEQLVVDFGQNCAGVPSFVFQAQEGTQLTFLPAELLNDGNGAKSRGMDGPEGSIHRQNLRIHEHGIRVDYTFGHSQKAVSYTPTRTFFGYRYASITATDDVRIKRLVTIPVSSITQEMEIGDISTGNALINQLISNTLWGQRSNYLSVPTDCPQRNERLGWTADTQVFSATGAFFANTNGFFHKWLQDLRDSQSDKGGFPGVAPFGQYGSGDGEMMRLGWADAGIIVPWTIWKQFGDRSIIEESWASMVKFIEHINDTKYDHQALAAENGNYQWADWLSYEPLESCGGGAFDGGPRKEAVVYWNFLGASYWVIDAGMMAQMAQASGRYQEATRYQKMAEDARQYIREKFLDKEGNFHTAILNTMQTPALFLLYNNILNGEARQKVTTRLRENFRAHGNCLQTGFLGTSIIMRTLTDNGMTDIAYELLLQRRNPSWLYSVDNGATTVWERWNSYTYEHGMGPSGMNSFNHYAYGCVCQWIWETVAGIASDPDQPGFEHIIMRPQPDKRLGHLKATYRSAAGTIKSHWRYKGDEWIWTFSLPKGTKASVTLPGETTSKEYTAGTYTIHRKL